MLYKHILLMQWTYWHCLLLYLNVFLLIAFLQFLMIFYNVFLHGISFFNDWICLYRLITWLSCYLPNSLQLQCRLCMKQWDCQFLIKAVQVISCSLYEALLFVWVIDRLLHSSNMLIQRKWLHLLNDMLVIQTLRLSSSSPDFAIILKFSAFHHDNSLKSFLMKTILMHNVWLWFLMICRGDCKSECDWIFFNYLSFIWEKVREMLWKLL